jgi:hypothetical protein
MQIENILQNMHRLEDVYRYILGTHIEEWARETVNARLTKTIWSKTNKKADCQEKRDWQAQGATGGTLYAQFKGRATGNDILVCAYQPFFGLEDERTKLGRDMMYNNIHYYVTYPPMSQHILVSRAADVKSACNKLVAELKRRDGDFPFYSKDQSDPQDPRKRERPACCQLRFKVEEGKGYRRGEGKVLAFLPPHLIPHQKIEVDPADFRAYLVEKLKPRQAYFEFA